MEGNGVRRSKVDEEAFETVLVSHKLAKAARLSGLS